MNGNVCVYAAAESQDTHLERAQMLWMYLLCKSENIENLDYEKKFLASSLANMSQQDDNGWAHATQWKDSCSNILLEARITMWNIPGICSWVLWEYNT